MKGPYPPGTLLNPAAATEWDWEKNRLVRGQRYRVLNSFVDGDGDEHQPAEEWIFITSMFSRFDDELSLCVLFDSAEWKIPLFWTPDAQQEVIEHFGRYVVPVNPV